MESSASAMQGCPESIWELQRARLPAALASASAAEDGNQPTCEVLQLLESHMELHSANPGFPPIVLEQATEVEVFAVVGVVRQVKRRGPHVRARGRKELLRQFNLAVMPVHFPLHAHHLLGGCMNSIVM